MKKILISRLTKVILIILFFCIHTLVFAQSEPDTLKHKLEQITITATRSTEKIIDVPYAVSLVPEEIINNLRGYGLDEAVSLIPGVLAQSRSGNQDARITIRGFGARGAGDRSNSGTTRGIKILVDGIPETEPDGRTSFDLIDMSAANSVEVIRSNASALWGNAAGGVINISTEENFHKPFLNLQQQAGSFGYNKSVLRAGTLMGSGKITLTLSNTNFKGWREHSASSRLLVNLNIISPLAEKSRLGIYLSGTSNVFHIPGPLSLAQFNADASQAYPVYLQRDERRFNRSGRIGLSLDHQLNDNNNISATVYANPKYLQRSERNTFRDFTRYHVGGNFIFRNTAQVLPGIRNHIMAGLDEAYQDGAILFYSLSAVNGRGDQLRDNKREGANTFGVFLQNEIEFGERVSLYLGGRYDNVTYYSESFFDPAPGLQDKSFEKFTPKAGIVYTLSPVHSVYFNLGGGVEVPAGNETNPSPALGQDTIYHLNPLLEPITSRTFEAGTKHILYFGHTGFIHALSYDVAAYYISINNDIIPYSGGRFYFTAGKTRRTGLETSLNLLMNNGISLNGAFTISSSEYDEYLVDSVHYGKPGKTGDFSGNKSSGIPDMFFNAGVKYSPSFSGSLYIGLNFSYVGKYFVDDANTIEVPSYNILNASIGMNDDIKLTEHIYLRGFVNIYNIADKKYTASAFINPDYVNGIPVYIEPGLPRNIAASIQVSFR
ncbi:MAG: TonB-dependent receptor [Ignavibacteriaceae bacterium]